MKKLIVILFAAVMLLTGCKKDSSSNASGSNSGSTNPLLGWWADGLFGEPPHHCYIVKFINDNTLILYYGDILDVNYGGMVDFPDHSGWYYESGSQLTLTYVFQDNKVIITNGDILSYIDDKLYLDGSSKVLSRW